MSPKTLTNEDVDSILKHTLDLRESGEAWKKAVRNYVMIVLMLDTGLRVGEMVQLKIADLYFQVIPVKTLVIRAVIAKNKRERTVPMSTRAYDALKLFHTEFNYLFASTERYYAFAFGNFLKPMSTRQVERIVRKIAMGAIGRPVHPHVFRHTFATRLMRVTDSRTVQELLGHKHITSTQIYTHPDENDKLKAIACMDSGCVDTSADLNALSSAARVTDRPDTRSTNRNMR